MKKSQMFEQCCSEIQDVSDQKMLRVFLGTLGTDSEPISEPRLLYESAVICLNGTEYDVKHEVTLVNAHFQNGGRGELNKTALNDQKSRTFAAKYERT